MDSKRDWRERLKSVIRSSLSADNLNRVHILSRAYREVRQTYRPLPRETFPISVDTLRDTCVELGIQEGDLVHVHTSVSHLMRGSTRPPERPIAGMRSYSKAIVDLLIELVGPTGTITMGTDFDRPDGWFKRMVVGQELPGDVFDARLHSSNRGLVSEYFRKRPDVTRSVYPFYNITAWGRHASELVKDHERSTPYAQDVHSPWYKMTAMKGKVLLLGRTFDINSLVHLVEYLHPVEYPRPLFMSRPVSMGYIDNGGNRKNVDVLLHISGSTGGALFTPQSLFKFGEYINERYDVYRIQRYSSDVQIVCYDAKAQYDAFYTEMKRNVTWYDPQFLP